MAVIDYAQVAHEYGTPSFVFDTIAFKQRMQCIREIVGDNVGLCYAIKANPFLIPAAAEVADKLEVCSPGELAICEELDVDPAMIVFSGVNKTPESVHEAAEFGVGVFTAESLKHAALIEAEGAVRGQVLDVLPRLNSGSQFGMSRADLMSLVDNKEDYPHLNIVGIHYFVGTQRKKLKHQRKELSMLLGLFDELRDEHGFEVERLEYGPGLGVPLFEGEDFSDTLEPARELRDALQEVAGRVELTIEMGRFFATECGTYLTSVNDLKTHDDGTNYCIVDGGINHLAYVGQLMGMKVPIIRNLTLEERGGADAGDEHVEWCVCGSLCTTNDILTRGVELQDLREGDVLAFENCGAYSVTEGLHLFLSRTMPRIIMRAEEGELVVARDFTETSALTTPHMK